MGNTTCRVDLFFSDRPVSQSGQAFSAELSFAPPPLGVPAPRGAALFGPALAGLLAARRAQTDR